MLLVFSFALSLHGVRQIRIFGFQLWEIHPMYATNDNWGPGRSRPYRVSNYSAWFMVRLEKIKDEPTPHQSSEGARQHSRHKEVLRACDEPDNGGE